MLLLQSKKHRNGNTVSQFFCLIFPILPFIFPHSILAVDWTQQTDRLFINWDKTDTPGLALVVVHNGEIVYQKGYGMANLRYGIPITSSTVFRTGSNSKQFTAFSILLLEEEGKLSLDDDIRLYVPEIPPYQEIVTIRHLLYHTSGIRSHISMMTISGLTLFDDLVTREQILALLERQTRLNFDPGDQFMYSNGGYMLLAEIVARVSGMTFPEFVRERIFAPLGMTHSGYIDNNRLIIENMADAYMPLEDGGYEYTPINYASVGEGGMYSTVEDLAKWDQNFYDPIVGSRSLIATMKRKGGLNDGTKTPFSMGLVVESGQGPEVVYHGGDIPGFHCQHVRVPSFHLSVIILANTSDFISSDLVHKSIQIIEYFMQNQTSSLNDYLIHEPSLAGWGLNGFTPLSPDLDLFPSLLNPRKTPIETGFSTQNVSPQFTPETSEEYAGRYYSEELDIFYTVSYEEGFLTSSHPVFIHICSA